ncbi:MAG TPA: M20 family metallopeptidase [Mycobacteriales bacterium]|nr:M20 family metallopeptidase [Mycobacteriales bacterium]
MTVLISDAAFQDTLVRLRRTLHADPEIGLSLPHTQRAVLDALSGLPLEITTGRSSTSVVAVLRGAPGGRAVLLRGDMDALPVIERTGLPFAASGDAMHACGHDLHTAMLVGAAHLLAGQPDLPGDVVFMFQPGEEGDDGASHMVAEGVLDAAGRRVDAAFAIHVVSALLPAGFVAGRAGTALSAADTLLVTVRGAGGHGSSPHRALDPIPAACEMVTALQTFVTRSFDVFDPVVVTVGEFHAGTIANVIPDVATFSATVRSFSREAQARVTSGVTRVCEGIAAAHGLQIDAVVEPGYPVTVNSDDAVSAIRSVVIDTLGADHWIDQPTPVSGSEDFSRVLDEVPGAMVFLGATPPGLDPGTAPYNHSPEAVFDDSVLATGAALHRDVAIAMLTG